MSHIHSSRYLECKCHRNLEVTWLLGQLPSDHNTITSFLKNNCKAIA
ncbi:transposase [Pontibacter sp. HJ8]